MRIFNIIKFKNRRRSLRKNATFTEKVLWQELRGKKLGYKFRRQHGIGSYIVDFYCPQLKLVIELDGSVHSIITVQKKDKIKEQYLEQMGFVVKRYLNEMVLYEKNFVLDDIYFTCQRLSVLKSQTQSLLPRFPLMLRGKFKRGLI
jgi:very-short-patch-repair endonuclease